MSEETVVQDPEKEVNEVDMGERFKSFFESTRMFKESFEAYAKGWEVLNDLIDTELDVASIVAQLIDMKRLEVKNYDVVADDIIIRLSTFMSKKTKMKLELCVFFHGEKMERSARK